MIDAVNTVASLWWSWMGPMLWQASLLILIVAVVDRIIQRWARPEVRHALWLLVFIKLIIPPSITSEWAVIPRVLAPVHRTWAALQPATGPPATLSAARVAPVTADFTPGRALTAAQSASGGALPTRPQSTPTWTTLVLMIWALGMVVVAVHLVSRTRRLRRWHKEQEEKRTVPPWFLDLMVDSARKLGLERLPAIVFSNEIAAPAVYGTFRPVLLLPEKSISLSHDDAANILMHELAHIKRGDLLSHAACLVLQVVYWFNPLLPWARHQLKHVRELCCDLTVARHLREKSMGYRKTLLETARRLLSESVEPGLALLGVFEEPFRLVARLRWLERETWRRRTPSLLAAACVLAIGVPVVLPMAQAGDTGGLGDPVESSVAPPPESTENRLRSDDDPHPGADPATYIRNEFVASETLLWFTVSSKLIAVSETWIGNNIIAGSERGKTVIIDQSRGSLIFIDHSNQTWVEADLPLDVAKLFSKKSLLRHREIRSSGSVTPTHRKKRVLGRRCREYLIHSWTGGATGRVGNEEKYAVWATTDVPFDLDLYDALLLNLRLIYNRDAAFRTELETIDGLQMRLELQQGGPLIGKTYVDETVVLEQRVPPPGTFEPPPGYEQRERIEDI